MQRLVLGSRACTYARSRLVTTSASPWSPRTARASCATGGRALSGGTSSSSPSATPRRSDARRAFPPTLGGGQARLSSQAKGSFGRDFEAHVLAMESCSRCQRWDVTLTLLHMRHRLSRDWSADHEDAALADAEAWTGSGQMVVFLASHIDCERRLFQLQQCLESITGQAPAKPLAVLASVSAADADLLVRAMGALEAFNSSSPEVYVHVLPQQSRRSQFSHFAALVPLVQQLPQLLREALAPSRARLELAETCIVDDVWLLFTDDDDIWHPCRTLVFEQATRRQCGGQARRARVPVAVPLYAMNTGDASACNSHGDVDAMMMAGSAGIITYKPEEASQRSFLEFWLHAVPARVFLDFVACTPSATLDHPLCDVRFSTFVRDHAHGPTAYFTPPLETGVWMYFHRQHEEQATHGLRTAATVSAADAALAAGLRSRLQEAEAEAEAAGGPGPASRGRGEMHVAQMVAEIRRDVEMLVLYGSLEREVVVEAALRRQDLVGTPTAAVWAEVAAELASAAAPALAPPPAPYLSAASAAPFGSKQAFEAEADAALAEAHLSLVAPSHMAARWVPGWGDVRVPVP